MEVQSAECKVQSANVEPIRHPEQARPKREPYRGIGGYHAPRYDHADAWSARGDVQCYLFTSHLELCNW